MRRWRRRRSASPPRGGTGRAALPALRPRVARRAVPRRPARLGASGCRKTAWRSAGASARNRSRRRPSSRFPRLTRRTFDGPSDIGFPVSPAPTARRTSRRSASRSSRRRVTALYVFDPGPDGSIGDVSWVISARASGKLPLLIVHGVLMTDLARAADIVLPGASRSRRTRPTSTSRASSRRPRGRCRRRETRRRTGRSSSTSASPSAPRWIHQQRPRAGGRRGGDGRRTAPTPTSRPCRLRGRWRRRLAAGVQPVRALEMGRHVPGPAAGEVRRARPEPTSIPGAISAAEDRLSAG